MGDSKNSFHPAMTVNNIKTSIPLTLTMEDALKFMLVIPPKEKKLWSVLDAAVLGWISHDLLQTIMEPDSTAMEAWNRLKNIFQDNQNSRAVTLEHEFCNTQMEDFPNASAYCQRLKSLSDQLKNVGAPVDNNRLVLQLVSGLTEPYNGVATLIRQSNPLPQFYQSRSMLTLEEAGLAKRAATNSASAMVAGSSRDVETGQDGSGTARGKNKNSKKNGGKKQNGGSGGGSRGGSGAGGAGRGGGQQQPQWSTSPWGQQQQWPSSPWGWVPQWATPP
ncbi:uncharacterized protein LOC110703160 [Chenopodium quinoa]|uniref:uncharacterized protein LOC110703160 n=1 Tax=Chenopodium quinoa TaxID=63459 RepID=UPI000B79AB5E|nr:uncharacterized protein LOC110703160 [Chenopodium quinoa]